METAIAILAKGTILLLATFGLASALRGASAASRHLVWTVGLAALVALPLFQTSTPWRLEVLPWEGDTGAAATRASIEDGREAPLASEPAESRALPAGEAAEPAEAADRAAGLGLVDGARETPAATTIRDEAAGSIAASPAPASPAATGIPVPTGWGWLQLAVLVWAVGAALVIGRLGLSLAAVWWLARRAHPLTDREWYGPLGRVMERLSLRTPVRLLVSGRTPMPITCGIVRPSVVLPAEAVDWPEDRREVVLLHELAHVRRVDLGTHLLAWVACAAWWFHPLVWVAARRLRAESELACDDLVLRSGTRASAYAEHLLEIVRAAGRASSPALAMPMAQRKGFEGRLLSILEPDLERRGVSRSRATAVIAVLFAVAFSLAAMAPARSTSAPDGEEIAAGTRVSDPAKEPGWIPLSGEGAEADEASPEADRDPGLDMDSDAASELGLDGLRLAPDLDAAADAAREATRVVMRQGASDALREAGVEQGAVRDAARVLAQLVVALKDAAPGVRTAAAWALGEIESPAGIPALAEAVRSDRDREVRKNAAWALGEIEDAAAVDALGAALEDDDAEVRAMAIWALGEIESPGAVPWLSRALRDGTIEERRKAAWALGEIESAAAVDALGTALSDRDPEVRANAAWALGEIESPAAVPWLSRALHDGPDEVRRKAAWALGEIESPQAVEALAAALSDSDVEVRKLAAWALGEVQPERAPRGLLDAARDSNAEVRENVAWALGEIEDPAAIPVLRGLLDDANVEVRKDALHALMEFDDGLAEDVLLDLLRSDDPEVRQEAAKALGERGDR